MTQMLPITVDKKPVRRPTTSPADEGTERPTWSDYRPKNPVRCDHCVLVAYETAMKGEMTTEGIRSARFKRRQGQVNLHLCIEHGNQLKADDQVNFPARDRRTPSKSRVTA